MDIFANPTLRPRDFQTAPKLAKPVNELNDALDASIFRMIVLQIKAVDKKILYFE